MIERLTEADFDQMFSLMERSFPEDERRDYNGQRELFAEPAYKLYAKRSPEDAALQAFLALWELGDMAYIEHFAVDPDCRNGGLGGKMTPCAVLVIQNGTTRLVNIKNQDTITKILDMVPDLVDRFRTKEETKVTEEDVNEILDEGKKQDE